MASTSASSAGEAGRRHRRRHADDPSCVLFAVVAEKSAAKLRAVIEAYAKGSEERRSEAVNYVLSLESGPATPIDLAHTLRRGDLVGVLLEAGADATAIGPKCDALALAIYYGQLGALRALLRSGRYDANGPFPPASAQGSERLFLRPVHLAVVPSRYSLSTASAPPQLEALAVLVREFGADVNGRDSAGRAPLHWLVRVPQQHQERALDALLALGADLERRDNSGETPVLAVAHRAGDVQLLLSRGASANVFDANGCTPLIRACSQVLVSAGAVSALVRASSPETRRAVVHGSSAVDSLLACLHLSNEPWLQEAVAELLSSRAPVRPEMMPLVLPIVARVASRRWGQAAAMEARVGAWAACWRGHDEIVQLAFDLWS